MEATVRIILALLMLGCLAKMPYEYFRVVRFLGMVGFAFLAFRERERGNEGLFWFWIASAVLINPIFKISLGRTLWNMIDVGWAIALVWPLWIGVRR